MPRLPKIKKYNYVTLAIMLLVVTGVLLCSGFNNKTANRDYISDSGFAGSASCVSCHKDISQTHAGTAHDLTSRPASAEFIKGSFDSGKNYYNYNKFMGVLLEHVQDSFYQTAYINNVPFQSEPFDIVVGSGRKGQTYLYWNDNQLFQLPVSYYTPLKSWCNSPGYSDKYIRYNRVITGQCLECHASYAKVESQTSTVTLFDKTKTIYGITCERCHGPAAAHVAYQAQHPQDKTAKYIINPARLNRQQRLDACALCHSGLRKQTQPSFSFQTGDKLDDFSQVNYNADSVSALDVHGNQYGLLTSSKCFRMSQQMDCSSCHNVHQVEVKVPEIFSQRCMNCHNQATHKECTMTALANVEKTKNCIDCHMPLLPSKKIFLQMSDKENSTPDFVRTHHVGIYLPETQKYLQKLKNAAPN